VLVAALAVDSWQLALGRFLCKPNQTTKTAATTTRQAYTRRRTVTYFAWATQAGGLQCSHGHEENGNLCKALHFFVFVFAGSKI
jgi:hypothetical protein